MVYFWTNSPSLVGKSMRVLIPVPRGTLCIDGACYGYYDNEYAEVELYPGKHYIMIRTASYVAIVEADVSSSINGNVLDIKSHAATLIHLVLSGASGDRLYIDGQLAAIIGRDPSPTTLYVGTPIHIGVSGQGCTVKTVAANGRVTGTWPCTAPQSNRLHIPLLMEVAEPRCGAATRRHWWRPGPLVTAASPAAAGHAAAAEQ